MTATDFAHTSSAMKSYGGKSIFRAVKFAYTNEISTSKIMEDVFDMDHLKAVSGGKGVDFDTSKYAERIKEDEKRMPSFRRRKVPSLMGIVSETVTTVENTQVIDSGKKETKSKPNDPLQFEVVQHIVRTFHQR
uniref:Uncharacterized protein n=1 Tax=Salix viminalis TaxID=40686 RepID=A0A6N2LWS1_SALVM